ncbi:MAG: FAD-binding protein [Rhizobiaceae bacterium]
MKQLSTFGRVLAGDFAVASPRDFPAVDGMVLPYGNGKSYGDVCLPQAHGRTVVDHDLGEQSFDETTGILIAKASTTVAQIILYCGPANWFVPVTPGTKHITLGGAIANDVHGKNHHLRGSFGSYIAWFDLLKSDGKTYRCSPDENADLFAATIGGMGLTGYITRAGLRMMKVPGCNIAEKTIPFASLDAYFDAAEQADHDNEYAVAWVDQLASGKSSGRGLLFVGNHTEGPFTPHPAAKISVPFVPPINVLNGLSVRAFNLLYRSAKMHKTALYSTHYDPFFYPLDMVDHWNRLYGPRGLHQHQSVIPFDAAKTVIPQLLEQSRRAGQVSFLTVIKRFGSEPSSGLLSFARPGYTLTLDFPHKGASTLALLDTLDRMTIECGGAVNPYKDSRMSPQTFAASFPNWRKLEAMRDPRFMSGFWSRTAMQLPPD